MLKKLLPVFLLLNAFVLEAQDRSAEAKKYFEQFLASAAFYEASINALPTLEECKMVFGEKDALVYFKYAEQAKEKAKAEASGTKKEDFADVRISSFTLDDMKEDKGNYPGGMKEIQDKLLPGTVFYTVKMLREKGAEHGVTFNAFVYLNNRWVFFAKPWKAFQV